MNIGLYFGSFNPIHNGHLIIANYIAQFTDIQKVWLVPSPHNPHKPVEGLLNGPARLHMATLATEGNPLLEVSDAEFSLPTPSYTINTLSFLSTQHPNHTFSLIMGGDSYQYLHTWKSYEQIVAQYPLFVYRRAGYNQPNPNIKSLKTTWLDAPLLDISATYIRHYVATKKSIRYLVPDAVEREITEKNYYCP